MARFVDVRFPAGALFVLLGGVLLGYGLFGSPSLDPARINRWWGAVLLLVGVGFLALARRARRRLPRDAASSEIASGPKGPSQ